MTFLRALAFLLFFINCAFLSNGISLERLQDVVLRSRRYAYQKPDKCELDGVNDNLCFYGSSKVPYQMAILNITKGTGFVVDNIGKKVAILDKGGNGVILDNESNTGVQVNSPPTSNLEFPDILAEYNVSHAFERYKDNSFRFDDYNPEYNLGNYRGNFNPNLFLREATLSFGNDFADFVNEAVGTAGSLVWGVMAVFLELMKPMSMILAPFVILATAGFLVVKAGIMAIWKIFKTLANFALKIAGGVVTLIAAAISIPLGLIIVALNGLMAFFLVLYEIAKKLTLADILGFMLASPFIIFEIIAGLGGMVLFGIAGVFTIAFHIVKLVAKGIISVIKSGIQFITNMVLRFFGLRVSVKISYNDHIQEGSQLLLDLFNNQNQKYRRGYELQPLVDFTEGISYRKPFKIYGVNMGQVIKTLTDPTIPDGLRMASEIVSVFSPFQIPRFFNRAMAGLFSSSVSLLANERDPGYVRSVIPSVNLPPGTELQLRPNNAPPLELPTYQLIQQVPQLDAVFKTLNDYSMATRNISLIEQLERDPEFKNQINIGIRRILAA
ncbi:uncharacterized protein LOC143195254 [Rhynchophorus ferrugineus]|uniref:uncharacterized protein LOC143195254 n=1 Tax=Rhynchophorus ferrugineus TaxID=354439 RepID=UPI003FCD336C